MKYHSARFYDSYYTLTETTLLIGSAYSDQPI